jgi:lysophospholipase L1-like esterase
MLALAFDQTVRLLLPPEAAPQEERPWYLKTVEYHPVLGWSGFPNFVETHDGIRIQTNSLGYRDREPAAAEDQKLRVLFLGDSFTWGDEVRDEERFTALLEASCGSQCDRLPMIQAINEGIIGYGTAQSYLQYLLTRQEHKFDVVILGFFSGNDLTDNAAVDSHSGPRPRLIRCDADVHSDGLCLEGVPVPPIVDWPEHRVLNPRGEIVHAFGWSGLVTLASRRRAPVSLIEKRITDQTDAMLKSLPFPIVQRTSDAAIKDRIGQLEAILRAMDNTIRGEGKAFGVLLFPSARLYAGEAGDEVRDYREILNVLGRLGIPFADYYEQTKDARWEDLFFELQGHWRPAAHQQAAALLRELLVAMRTGQKPL